MGGCSGRDGGSACIRRRRPRPCPRPSPVGSGDAKHWFPARKRLQEIRVLRTPGTPELRRARRDSSNTSFRYSWGPDSTMTCAAVRSGIDVILFHELAAVLDGVPVRMPSQVGDQLAVADVGGGIPVAVEAPGHAERRELVYHVHLVDAAMALHAADALVDVGAMVEVRELRQLVDA